MARTTPVNTGYNIINGTSTGTNGAYVDCWLEWKILSQSITANTSQVRVLLYAAATISSGTAWTVAEKFGYVGYGGGNKQYKSTTYNFANKAVNCFGDYTFTIAHDDDGTKTVTLQGAWSTSHSSYISGGSASGKVTLTTIARASTIRATDANIGAVALIAVTQRSTAYTHSIAYQFGDLSGYLNADGSISATEVKLSATSVPFQLPESFYEQIPDDPSGTCTLTCKTYSGNTQIGKAQTCTFTATAAQSLCTPEVSGTVEDINEATLALTGDPQTLVRYMSTVLCAITAQAKNGASISQKKIGGATVKEDTRTIAQVETVDIPFWVQDSRGYPATYTPSDLTIVPYIRLTCNASARRTDPTSGNAILQVKGNYFGGSFGAADNTLAISYCVNNGEYVNVDVVPGEGSYEGSVSLAGLDYQRSHTIDIRVEDALETVIQTVTVGKGIPVFDWGENDFVFHVPVDLPSLTVEGQTLADYIRSIMQGG